MSPENERKRKPEVIIRQMEIDDISSVYHLGEELFTSEELPILYRTWDPYEVTDHFTPDSDYCLVAKMEVLLVSYWLLPLRRRLLPRRNMAI